LPDTYRPDEETGRVVTASKDQTFADLYDRHRSAVWLYSRRRVGADRADDILGEVFLTVWRRIDQAPPGHEALPWLYRICYLTISNHWRGAARRWRLESKLSAIRVSPPSSIADQVVVREEARAVVRLLDNMRSADAEILRLAAWEGLDTTEMAVVLEITPDAAKQRLSRARMRLTDLYEDTLGTRQPTIGTPDAQEGGVW
jgi:RNA polymerase sigma-70 factor (ECF subfamily)